MSLQLFGPPFSSYTWKVLFALWADDTRSSSVSLAPITPRTATRYAAVGRPDNSVPVYGQVGDIGRFRP